MWQQCTGGVSLGLHSAGLVKAVLYVAAFPGVLGNENMDLGEISISSAFWQLLKAFEITNLVFAIGGTFTAVILIALLWKTYKYSKACYSLCRSMVMELNINDTR
jgi:hypothetical protein